MAKITLTFASVSDLQSFVNNSSSVDLDVIKKMAAERNTFESECSRLKEELVKSQMYADNISSECFRLKEALAKSQKDADNIARDYDDVVHHFNILQQAFAEKH